jgi:hypothetical protein
MLLTENDGKIECLKRKTKGSDEDIFECISSLENVQNIQIEAVHENRKSKHMKLLAIVALIAILVFTNLAYFMVVPNSSSLIKQHHYQKISETEYLFNILEFKFCKNLNNATFNTSKHLTDFEIKSHIYSIDYNALEIYNRAKLSNVNYESKSLLRFSCFSSLFPDTNVNLNSLIKLHALSPSSYFPYLSYDKSDHVVRVRERILSSRICELKLYYKIIYVVMARNNGLDKIQHLYDILYDEDAFFYFHIDGKEPWFEKTLKEWLYNDPLLKTRCNAAIIPNPTTIIWGHITMVFAQNECFFQVYHLFKFDYVINLSPEHYPKQSTNAIHLNLEVSLF